MATLGDTTIDRRHLLGVFLVLAALYLTYVNLAAWWNSGGGV